MTAGNLILTVVLACLGSTGFFSLLQFLISRKDKKAEKDDECKKDLKEIKRLCNVHDKDICRIQLLLLISDYPDNKTEIMTLGEHYFKDLKANWYMSSIFNTWLKEHEIIAPEWFNVE